MKTALLTIILAGVSFAQVTVTISSQGTGPIKMATGYTTKTADLMRMDVCNDGDAGNPPTGRIISNIIAKEKYGVYESDVVADVLNVLQQRDVFTRAQKAIGASANAATLITALFKTLSPLTVVILQAAPAIAQAVLPAVGDPRDIAALSRQIMQDNGTISLGKKGSGNDCKTMLAVAMTPKVAVDVVVIP